MSARLRPAVANEPTRARSGCVRPVSGARAKIEARAEPLRRIEGAFEAPEPSGRPPESEWAIRYLETVRGFKPAPAPMSQAEQVKLAEVQADRIVGAITAVLDGLGLSEEDRDRGRKLASDALRAASTHGWEPL
jgi:hypothetical protein